MAAPLCSEIRLELGGGLVSFQGLSHPATSNQENESHRNPHHHTPAHGIEDIVVTGLTETALIISGVDYTTGIARGNVLLPTDGQFLYLAGSQGTNATYTAGRFLIELLGV